MKKSLCILYSLILTITLSGCVSGITSFKNVDEMVFARVLAIDKSDNNEGNVVVTAAYEVTAGSGASDTSSKKNQFAKISSEGKTVYDTVRSFNSFSGKNVYLGQVDYILLSEEAAKDGLFKYVDFFTRYYEVNLNTDIFIVKGSSAKKILDKASQEEYFISKYLKDLIKDSKYLSISREVKLKDIMRTLNKSHISPSLPYLKLKESLDGDKRDYIQLDGYAFFDGDKPAGYLTGKEARGFSWITGKITSGIILVKGKKGKDISLEIHSSETKIYPALDDDNTGITVHINMSSNISEQTSPEDIYDEQTLKSLIKQQNQIIRKEVENTFSLAKDKHADVFGIGDIIYHKHPVKWQRIKNNWPRRFAELKINVEVESEIKRTYIIEQPIGSEIIKNE